MAQQTINVGSAANDGTGDPLRTAFGKANSNFTELYARSTGGSGSGTVSSGTTGKLAGYIANGTAVSPITVGSGLSFNTGTSTLTATGAGSSGSPLIVSLYANGITSDATNGIDYGATAPAGSTGQEASINSILAAAFTAAGNAGVEIVWDVAVALGAPVYLYSNMTVRAPNPQCGAIMRAATNCPMWRVKGMDATVSSNTSTQSQKNFGKIDSTAFGTTTGSTAYQYRVIDTTGAMFNAKNISILGGTWNGNSPAQTVSANTGSATYGLLSLVQIWGVDGLTIKSGRFFTAISYVMQMSNVRKVVIEDVDCDQIAITTFGNDCIHFNGPATNLRLARIQAHTSDDHVAFNADDIGTGGNFTAGINLHCSGPITTARVNGLQIWAGRENVTPWGAVRILSTAARVDDIIIWDVSGSTGNWGFLCDTYPSTLLSGSGNVGRVVYDDVSLDVTTSGAVSNAVFLIGANSDSIEIRNRRRYNAASAYYDIRVEPACTVKSLLVSGLYDQPAGATNNPEIIRVGGTVKDIQTDIRVLRDSTLSTAAMPVLKVLTDPAFNGRSAGTGVVGKATLNVDVDYATNVVDIQAGTVTTLILKGSHTNAGGGSPLAIASGATLTNYVYGNGATPFTYAHANVAAKSGAGTVTNLNDYVESSTFPLTFPGTAGNAPTGNSALTPFSGNNVTGFVVDGAGNLTIGSGSYAGGYFAAAGTLGDGACDFAFKSGNTNRRLQVLLRCSGASLTSYYVIKSEAAGVSVSRMGTSIMSGLTLLTTDTSFGLRISGTTLTYRRNGVDQSNTYTDSSPLAAGYVGIGSTDGGASQPAISSISFS